MHSSDPAAMSDTSKTEVDNQQEDGCELQAIEYELGECNDEPNADIAFDWAATLASEANHADSLTVGVVSGSRNPNDTRTVDRLMAALSQQLDVVGGRTLRIRLETVDGGWFGQQNDSQNDTNVNEIPIAKKSALGSWSEVEIEVFDRAKTTWQLQQLPEWLPVWKDAFKLILVDLGPISSPASRAAGRLCDGCYVLLGPETCGSPEWIMQQTAWHSKVGSAICGSLLASLTKAA